MLVSRDYPVVWGPRMLVSRDYPAVWGARISRRHALAGSGQADLDLTDHVAPLLGRAECGEELVERGGVARRELEPREEVERLAQLAAVVQAAGDPGQIGKAA